MKGSDSCQIIKLPNLIIIIIVTWTDCMMLIKVFKKEWQDNKKYLFFLGDYYVILTIMSFSLEMLTLSWILE